LYFNSYIINTLFYIKIFMKILLLICSIIFAFFSVTFRDTLYNTWKHSSRLLTTETGSGEHQYLKSAFEGLVSFTSKEIYRSPDSKNMATPRAIRKAFLAVEQAEGAGARVRRSIGGPQLRNFSPFLLLDHFSTTSLAGFPDHPHRGQGKPTNRKHSFANKLMRSI
jgi:hypothetical protein